MFTRRKKEKSATLKGLRQKREGMVGLKTGASGQVPFPFQSFVLHV